RVIMAYTLPVDTVPALDGVLYFVTYLVLQVITHIVLHKSGVFRQLFPGRGRRPARSTVSASADDREAG
ncbi:VC0807 family protein, partial [Streptomyces kronopolitis]